MPMAIDYDLRWWCKERHTEIRILTPRCENYIYVITGVLFLKSSEPVQIETMICCEENKIYLLFCRAPKCPELFISGPYPLD